mgnify:CR=1 FL=1
MREPHFWTVQDKRSRASAPMTKLLLTPLSMIYRWAGRNRIARATPVDAGLPVICIGNLTLGEAAPTARFKPRGTVTSVLHGLPCRSQSWMGKSTDSVENGARTYAATLHPLAFART